MNKRLFVFVIIMMAISLAGIILLQLFWIRNAISIREDHFNKTVNLALRTTADKLESHENILILSDRIGTYAKQSLKGIYISDSTESNQVISYSSSDHHTSYSYSIDSDNDSDFVIEVWNEVIPEHPEQLIEYKYDIDMDSLRHQLTRLRANVKIDSLSDVFTHDIVYVKEGSDSLITGPDDGYLLVKRAQNLNDAFIKMAFELESTPVPIEERIDSTVLIDILTAELFNKGINTRFEYALMHVDSLRSFPMASPGFDGNDIDKKFVVSIFPNELIEESNFLILQFPGRNTHILGSMAWTLSGSLLLTLIILATFGITIFMILRQKKLSDIKSDFINNMTHEFKTPIATISLAVDSIDSPKIINKEKDVRYYTGIIREENQRMNNHVESVLRMSLLEKHDLEFRYTEVDVHELIQSAVSKVSLLLKERNGSISIHTDATNSLYNLDPDHFTNALLNLLDNAIKYSEDQPKIEVSTKDIKQGIGISVSDHGIGMSKDIQHKIFERFYRKTSGNIHNVKGFGLGLSYVKAVVEAMGGSISVQSELKKGSVFTIVLRVPPTPGFRGSSEG